MANATSSSFLFKTGGWDRIAFVMRTSRRRRIGCVHGILQAFLQLLVAAKGAILRVAFASVFRIVLAVL
jgi:hypothetical protein